MPGRIHSVQTLGTVDGPGVRTVVFMQGCPLRCPYCHNPDTWAADAGQQIEAPALAQQLLRYRGYFGKSGGVTVSGGEPLMQAAFVKELFTLLHAQNIHTALDISACIWNHETEELLRCTDLVLLDIKAGTDELSKARFALPLQAPLRMLQYCQKQNIPVWVRHVSAPGWNDDAAELQALAQLTESFTCVQKVELLPFRTLCAEKYTHLGIPFAMAQVPAADAQAVQALQKKYF